MAATHEIDQALTKLVVEGGRDEAMGLLGRTNQMSIKWLVHRHFNPATHDVSSVMAQPLR
jgi:hypothetical protein